MTEPELQTSSFPAIRRVSIGAPLRWLADGAAHFRANPRPSVLYGACFALTGWRIAWVSRHSVEVFNRIGRKRTKKRGAVHRRLN
jgi:hypothetical protein